METSQVASADALQEHAATHPAKWNECRERGHAMSLTWAGLSDLTEEEGAYLRTLRCSRCGTKKHQVLDSEGVVLSSEYEYPEGYTLPKGTGRVDSGGRGIFRLAATLAKIRHQTDTQERTQMRRQIA